MRRSVLSRRSPRLLAASVGFLFAAVGAPALPAHASDLPDWPEFSWSTCADADAQYCVQEATVTPVGGVATPVAELGLGASVNTLPGFARSFNWSVYGWEGAEVPDAVRNGAVNLVIRTGHFVPRYTIALANSMRITRSVDEAGNTTMAITGHQVQIDWTTGDLFGPCVAGWDCGGPDTMADALGTGYRYMGNTQDMETWGEEAMNKYDGMYIASDAQSRPTTVEFWGYPEPYWSLQNLGNPHLDANGNPVRGSFNAWVPPSYFTSAGTTAAAAAAVGLDVISREGDTSVSIPATVVAQDGGVALSVADLGYSMHQISVFTRHSTAVAGSTPPAEPQQVAAAARVGSVGVRWSAPPSTGGSVVTGYTARAFTAASGGTVAGRCTATTTSCTIPGLTNGTPYYVAVSASNALGEGLSAVRQSVTPDASASTAPSAPRELGAVVGNGTVTAAWAPVASTGGSLVTSYLVKAYTGASGGDAVTTCVATVPSRTCGLTGLTNGTTYYLTAVAINDVGPSPESGPRVATTPRTVPSAATGLALAVGNRALNASWGVPVSTGGSPITGYLVKAYLTASGGTPVRTCTANAAARTCALGDLTSATPYYLTVTALNSAGAGPESTRVTGTPSGVPSAPQAVVLTPASGALAVTWAAPTSTGGTPITGYIVRAYLSGSGGSPVRTCTAAALPRACTLTGLTNATRYYVVVTAVNAVGTGAEASRVAGTPRTVPTVARSVTALVTAGKIKVDWLEPTSNGGSPVTGYRVSVYTTANGTGTPAATCTASASARTCTTATLATGRTYYVSVTTINAGGSSPASSLVTVAPRR